MKNKRPRIITSANTAVRAEDQPEPPDYRVEYVLDKQPGYEHFVMFGNGVAVGLKAGGIAKIAPIMSEEEAAPYIAKARKETRYRAHGPM